MLEIVVGTVASAFGVIAVGWMAWVSKLLISVQNAVTGTAARLNALEDWREEVQGFMDNIAPRTVP